MIDEHNIEQHIFEYHEGLMDASQKQDLMEYLHQYPEYQRDFAIWAQARLHDEGVATPVFQQKLMKPNAWIPSTMLKWSVGIGTLSIVCFLAVVFYPRTEIPKSEIIKTVDKKTKISAPIEKIVISKKAQNQTFKKKIKLQEQTIPTVSLSEEAKTETKIDELKFIQKEEISDIKLSTSEQAIHLEETAEKSNTDDSNYFLNKPNEDEPTQDEEPIQPKKTKKPKRPKQKMSLKPNADILPTSPNF